jgi:hypothetical protein
MQVPEPGAVQEMPPLPRVERLSAMGRFSLVERLWMLEPLEVLEPLERSAGRGLVSLPGRFWAEPAAPESRRDNPDSGPFFRPDCR